MWAGVGEVIKKMDALKHTYTETEKNAYKAQLWALIKSANTNTKHGKRKTDYLAIAKMTENMAEKMTKDNKFPIDQTVVDNTNSGSHSGTQSHVALVEKGGVCEHWTALNRRILRTIFEVEGNKSVKIESLRGESHTWLRIHLGQRCTQLDTYWASGDLMEADDGSETFVKGEDLDFSWIFKPLHLTNGDGLGPGYSNCKTPDSHAKNANKNGPMKPRG